MNKKCLCFYNKSKLLYIRKNIYLFHICFKTNKKNIFNKVAINLLYLLFYVNILFDVKIRKNKFN